MKRALQQLIEQLSDEPYFPDENVDAIQSFTKQLKHFESLLAVESPEHFKEASIDKLKGAIMRFILKDGSIDPDRKSLVYPLEVALTWCRPPNHKEDGYFVAIQNTQEGKKTITVKNLSGVIATPSRLHFPEFVLTEHKGQITQMFDWRDVVIAVNATGDNSAIQFPIQLIVPIKAGIKRSISLINEEREQGLVLANPNQDTLDAAYRPFYAWSIMRGISPTHMLYWNNFFHAREQKKLGSLIALCCQYMNLYQSLHYEGKQLGNIGEKIKNHALASVYLPNVNTVDGSDLHTPINHVLSNLALRRTATLIESGEYTIEQALTLSAEERSANEHIKEAAIVRFEQSLPDESCISYKALLRNTALPGFLTAINFTLQDFKRELGRSSNVSSIIQDLSEGSTLSDITRFASSFGRRDIPDSFVKEIFTPSALHKYVKSDTKIAGYHESIRAFLEDKNIALPEDESTQEKIASLSQYVEKFQHLLKENSLAYEVLRKEGSLLKLLEKYKMLTEKLRAGQYDEVLQEAYCCYANASSRIMLHVIKEVGQAGMSIQSVLFYSDKARGFWIEWDNDLKSITQQSGTIDTPSAVQESYLARIPILLTQLNNEKLIKEDLINLSSPIFKGIVTEGVMSFGDIATLPLDVVNSLYRANEVISGNSVVRMLSSPSVGTSSESGMSRIIRSGSNNIMELLSRDKTLQVFKKERERLLGRLQNNNISTSTYNTQLHIAFEPVVKRVSLLTQQLADTPLSSTIFTLSEAGVPLRKAIQILPGEDTRPNTVIRDIVRKDSLIQATFKKAGKTTCVVLLNRIYKLDPNIKIVPLLERALEIIHFFEEEEIRTYLTQLMPEEVLMLTKEKCDALRKLGKPLVAAGISPGQIIALSTEEKEILWGKLKTLTRQFNTVSTVLQSEDIDCCDKLLKAISEADSVDDTTKPVALFNRAAEVTGYLKEEVIQRHYQAGLITAAHILRLKESERETLQELPGILADDRDKAYFLVIKDIYAPSSVTLVVEKFKDTKKLFKRSPFLLAYSRIIKDVDIETFIKGILHSPPFTNNSYSEQALSEMWSRLRREDKSRASLAKVYAADSKGTPFLEHFYNHIKHYLETMGQRHTYPSLLDWGCTPKEIMHANKETQQEYSGELRSLYKTLKAIGLFDENAQDHIQSIMSNFEGSATLTEKLSRVREVRKIVECLSPIGRALLKFEKWPFQVILDKEKNLASLYKELRREIQEHKHHVDEFVYEQDADKGGRAKQLVQLLVKAIASPEEDIEAFKQQLQTCMSYVKRGYLRYVGEGLSPETALSLSHEEYNTLLSLERDKRKLESQRRSHLIKTRHRDELNDINQQWSALIRKLNNKRDTHPAPLSDNSKSTNYPRNRRRTAASSSPIEDARGAPTHHRNRDTFFPPSPPDHRENNRNRKPKRPPQLPSKGPRGFFDKLLRR